MFAYRLKPMDSPSLGNFAIGQPSDFLLRKNRKLRLWRHFKISSRIFAASRMVSSPSVIPDTLIVSLQI